MIDLIIYQIQILPKNGHLLYSLLLVHLFKKTIKKNTIKSSDLNNSLLLAEKKYLLITDLVITNYELIYLIRDSIEFNLKSIMAEISF